MCWSDYNYGQEVDSMIINTYEAKSKLSELIERALNGEEITIAKNSVPQVVLTPVKTKTNRVLGKHHANIEFIADDFNTPVAEIEEMFS